MKHYKAIIQEERVESKAETLKRVIPSGQASGVGARNQIPISMRC